MKTWLAIGVVIVANAVLLVNASRNRAATRREIELTERELQVVQQGRENTALFLLMTYHDGGDWLNAAKLGELGLDTSSERLVLPRPAYVALTLEERPEGSRLKAVDAALQAETLTTRYPDQSRYLISRGTVAIHKRQSSSAGSAVVLPRMVNVPLPPKPPLQRYTVKVRYGAHWEPWVTELTPKP